MGNDFSIRITDSNITGSVIGQADYYYDTRNNNDALILEIKNLQEKLEATEPLLSQTLKALEKAMKKEDKKSVANIARQLSSGFAASVLSNMASATLLKFLGI